jgi:uncharacterized protein
VKEKRIFSQAFCKIEFTMRQSQISIPKSLLADFCHRHHIRKLSLFGSISRDDFRDESDIDVLVEFEQGFTPGLEFFAMESELSNLLGRKVDLNTPGFLSSHFRYEVEKEAEVEYVSTSVSGTDSFMVMIQ